jgi:hypothetical protein
MSLSGGLVEAGEDWGIEVELSPEGERGEREEREKSQVSQRAAAAIWRGTKKNG